MPPTKRTGKQRIADYRARHRAAGLCIECDEKAAPFARCQFHREQASANNAPTSSEPTITLSEHHYRMNSVAELFKLDIRRLKWDIQDLEAKIRHLRALYGGPTIVNGMFALPAPGETTTDEHATNFSLASEKLD